MRNGTEPQQLLVYEARGTGHDLMRLNVNCYNSQSDQLGRIFFIFD